MAAIDESRHLIDGRMRYATALFQQGRVFTDSDFNEMVRLEADDRRRMIAETVCTQGSPNGGFKIMIGPLQFNQPVTIYSGIAPYLPFYSYDFSIGAGSFYLGGCRFTIDPDLPEHFQSQNDGLSATLDPTFWPSMPTLAQLAVGPRTDVVYLHGWHGTVTSVEDQEFRERGLGGPDTTVRVRRMRRVEVLPNVVAADCAAARAALTQWVTRPRPNDNTGVPHRMDDDGTELLSKTRLHVSFVGGGPNQDACRPKQVAGFLGADNQAIRVQLTAANAFIWGIDNASPLYRVVVDASDPGNQTLRFLTPPRDQPAMPLQGQAIEVLAWDALLANNEKVSDDLGFIAGVATSYDPLKQTMVLDAPVPDALIAWLAAQPAALNGRFDPPGQQKFFYARLWTGGKPTNFNPGFALPLPDTGLQVQFTDFGIPGDFWVIAARPNTPDQLVPWRLLDNAPPHGPHRFYAALARIDWSAQGVNVVASVQDCRERFRSLCRNNGCCQVIVGDDTHSFGDYSSIQDAINALPTDGGEVCVLRGRYPETLTLNQVSDVVIQGCGPGTVLAPPAGAAATAAIAITASNRITLRDFAIEATTLTGVQTSPGTSEVTLHALTITARDQGAIIAQHEAGLIVEECTLRTQPLTADLGPGATAGVVPLVFSATREARIAHNRLLADTSGGSRRTALGGLQIGGGATDVAIVRNRIAGGNGNGITLGSVSYVTNEERANYNGDGTTGIVSESSYYYDANGCVQIPATSQNPPGAGPNSVPVSDGNLQRIIIAGNRIQSMGQCGIAPAMLFFPVNAVSLITIDELDILDNLILGCMRLEVGPVALADLQKVAFGGIVLPDVEIGRIEHNRVEGVGASGRDAICGLYIAIASGVAIRHNCIRHNGGSANSNAPLKLGNRGGILIRFAIAPTETITVNLIFGELTGQRQDGHPAVVVHDNVVVAREGRALFITALGPVSITDNQLTAHGSSFLALLRAIVSLMSGQAASAGQLMSSATTLGATASALGLLLDALGGTTVFVLDLGWSNEIYFQLIGLDKTGGALPPARNEQKYFVGGNVIFSDNLVVYDALDQVYAYSLCSVFLVTFDTVTIADNQIECDLALDFVLLDLFAFGLSVQMSGNRLTEGVFNAYLSAVTLGVLMNSTGLNVATHCIEDYGLQRLSAASSAPVALHLNLVLTDQVGKNQICKRLAQRLAEVTLGWKLTAVDTRYLVADPGGV
jgi:hypothetical protein